MFAFTVEEIQQSLLRFVSEKDARRFNEKLRLVCTKVYSESLHLLY